MAVETVVEKRQQCALLSFFQQPSVRPCAQWRLVYG